MTSPERHRTRHMEIHTSLDELLADYLKNAKQSPFPPHRGASVKDTIEELLNWSNKQVEGGPDHEP